MADRAVIGDATETALLRHVANTDSAEDLRTTYAPALEVPFNSDRKWAAGVFNNASGGYTVYLKVSAGGSFDGALHDIVR